MPTLPRGPQLVDLGNPLAVHPLNNGLVFWWLGLPNQSTGRTLFDVSGKGRKAFFVNEGAWGPLTPSSGRSPAGDLRAVRLDGVNDYAGGPAANTFPTMTAATLACWAKWTTAADQKVIAFERSTGGASTALAIGVGRGTSTAVSAIARDAAGTLIDFNTGAVPAFNDGRWHRILATFGSDGSVIYVDGVSRAANLTVVGSPAFTWSATTVKLGAAVDASTSFFGGQLHSASMWNRVLSASEVVADYLEGLAGHPYRLRRYVPVVRVFGGASGTPATYTGTGALGAGTDTLTASATFTVPVYTGTGALNAGPDTLAAGATSTAPVYTGAGALNSGSDTLTASATFTVPVYTGTVVLDAGSDPLVAVAAFTAPVYTGAGALNADSDLLSAVATFTPPVYTGAAVLVAGSDELTATALFAMSLSIGVATLDAGSDTIAVTATFQAFAEPVAPAFLSVPAVRSFGALPGVRGFLAGKVE